MKFTVQRLRVRGVRVKMERSAGVLGELIVNDMPASAFGRPIRVARLLHPERPTGAAELLPPLLDVQLLQVSEQRLVLAGIERELRDGEMTDYAQTWLAEPHSST